MFDMEFGKLWKVGWLCWGLTSQSKIFQSCRDGAIASWVINQYFRGVKCLAQGRNTAAVGFEPRTSRSGVRHSTTEPPRSLSYGRVLGTDRMSDMGFVNLGKSHVDWKTNTFVLVTYMRQKKSWLFLWGSGCSGWGFLISSSGPKSMLISNFCLPNNDNWFI